MAWRGDVGRRRWLSVASHGVGRIVACGCVAWLVAWRGASGRVASSWRRQRLVSFRRVA
ncbi:hypothetical protein ACXZ9C_11395 [Streptococcus agalactiae]